MEDKVRVFEIAEEAGSTSAEVIKKASDLSIELKSPQSSVSFEQAESIVEYIMTGKSKLLPKKKSTAKPKIVKKDNADDSKKAQKEVVEDTIKQKDKVSAKQETKKKKVEPIAKRKELKIINKKSAAVQEEKTLDKQPPLKSNDIKEVMTVQEQSKQEPKEETNKIAT